MFTTFVLASSSLKDFFNFSQKVVRPGLTGHTYTLIPLVLIISMHPVVCSYRIDTVAHSVTLLVFNDVF